MKVKVDVPDFIIDHLKEENIDPVKFFNLFVCLNLLDLRTLDNLVKFYKGEINLRYYKLFGVKNPKKI